MPRTWRLIKAKHAGGALAGEGARLWGGRWNSKGVRMVYSSETLSLATLEVIVHIPFYNVLKNYVCIPIDFNSRLSTTFPVKELTDNWRTDPIPESSRAIGDRWIQKRHSVILKVPSTIIPVEYNYLINPAHPDFNKLVVHPPQKFTFDPRLIK